ncbi:MAG: DUF3261 domain-containing protein [Myxococcota bacterium]
MIEGSWMRSKALMLFLLALSLVFAGCESAKRGPESREEFAAESRTEVQQGAADLLPATALARHFVLRQRVAIRWQDESGKRDEASFDAAIQRQGDSLLLLGLGPMGQVGFLLRLENGVVHFENRTGLALPFEPARMLADVQRVYYPWFEPVTACDTCVRRAQRSRITVEETRAEGEVRTRRFFQAAKAGSVGDGEGPESREDGEDDVIVRYSGAPWLDGLGQDALLQSVGFGYEVELKTQSVDWID